jgi:nitric oxide reductase NorE protein
MNQQTVNVTATGTPRDDAGGKVRRIPGEPGIWMFVLLDSLVFMQLFWIFAWYRAENRELYQASQEQWVNPVYGLVYTILLLTSSWCIVMAITGVRKRYFDTACRFVLLGFALGAAFVVIKFFEYGEKITSGITPVTNEYFMFYFVMTIVHLVHVVVGLGVLAYVHRQIRVMRLSADQSDPRRMRSIETSGIYWHFVDMLWIVLFALFYLRSWQ